MDYITTRCILIKNLTKEQISYLHSIEKAVFDYNAKCAAEFKKTKVVPVLWWESGRKLMSLVSDKKQTFADAQAADLLKNAALASLAAFYTGSAADIHTIYSRLFKDITLMHTLDALVYSLPLTHRKTAAAPTHHPTAH
ncbi:hypothetical protein Dip518_001590 [Parelusimicrobium proximum]|uniref:hypothetical protein n=1 Tax=Parelusimicrobium proximum TaxID=3228953 RepID=UPI003D17F182